MQVKDRMTLDPVTVMPDTPVSEALNIMRQHNVRRMPVLDKHDRLVGIVAEKDLLYASPSPATSLNVYEIGYLLSKLRIKEIMTRDVVTITEDEPLEEAARVMVDNAVGALPVIRGDHLVGIITETDIFKVLLEMMGARDEGIRMSLSVEDQPGTLSNITGAISRAGGDIIALGTFYSDDRRHGNLVLRVAGLSKQALMDAMENIGVRIVAIQ
jgi:acetoin utilization protein AcuB